jgi:hypothetical protein
MKQKMIFNLFLFSFLIFSLSANAQIGENLSIHGFGGWGLGITDENHYLIGGEDRDYHHSYFALNIAAQPFDDFAVVVQPSWNESEDGLGVDLDYAMAEYSISDQFKFRFGRIKHSFGKYAEIYDVGTLRPFFSLPQSVYGPVGISAKSLDGIGFTGEFYTDSDWSINYDIYAGEINLMGSHPWAIEEDTTEHDDHGTSEFTELNHIKDMMGARVVFYTPLTGLNFSLSAFAGRPASGHGDEHEEHSEEKPKFGDHLSYSSYVEYNDEKWSFLTEYGVHDHGEGELTNSAYFQMAYKLTEKWQAALLYDWLKTDVEVHEGEEQVSSDLVKHTDLGLGLNYWLNPGFVLRVAYHFVDGNRFALPEDFHEAIATGTLNNETNFFMFGGQFSF